MIERGPGRPDAYKLADGITVVPSVTTIAKWGADATRLIRWAQRMRDAGQDPEAISAEAMATGSLAHEMVEEYIHGGKSAATRLRDVCELDGTHPLRRVADAYDGMRWFAAWARRAKPEYIATEIPLVSERHGFGGTMDLVCRWRGALTVADHKLKSGRWEDRVMQLGAYALLWEECRGERPTQGLIIGLDGKPPEVLSEHDLSQARADFLTALDRYEREAA